MKRVLICASTGLDATDLETLRSLAQRLLQMPSGLELTIVSEEPLHRRSRENSAARHATLPKVNAPVGTWQAADAQRPSLGAVLQDRAQTIHRIAEFAPDLIVVDGSPFGQYDEFARILATPWPVQIGPQWVLLLPDLLGCRTRAAQLWRERGYFEAIVSHYAKCRCSANATSSTSNAITRCPRQWRPNSSTAATSRPSRDARCPGACGAPWAYRTAKPWSSPVPRPALTARP